MSDLLIKGRIRDLGGFNVVRSIPHAKKRFVGPFVFLDHMGPIKVSDTSKLDVRPHPHIGLSTVTYLFSGRAFHRDSLGYAQEIKPGELNWMTAGKGIVHSERTPAEEINVLEPKSLHGIQIWVALPVEFEKIEPSFTHYSKDILPQIRLLEGLEGKLLIGDHKNIASPVKTYSRTLFIEATASKDIQDILHFSEEEIGIFLIEGKGRINGVDLDQDDIMIVSDPQKIDLTLSSNSKIAIIGGTPFSEPRHIWWNFVSSNKDDIQKAAQMWKEQSFPKVEGEDDFTPLPDIPLPS